MQNIAKIMPGIDAKAKQTTQISAFNQPPTENEIHDHDDDEVNIQILLLALYNTSEVIKLSYTCNKNYERYYQTGIVELQVGSFVLVFRCTAKQTKYQPIIFYSPQNSPSGLQNIFTPPRISTQDSYFQRGFGFYLSQCKRQFLSYSPQ